MPPPLPPPRRKVTSGGSGVEGGSGGGGGLVRHASLNSNGSGRGVHRRSSLSVSSAGAFSPTSPTAHEARSPGQSSTFGSSTNAGSVSPLNMKSMLGAIERTGDKITGRLAEQLQPKLEKARFKAEAGLNSRRGFIPPPNHNPHHANAHLTSRDDREAREGLMMSGRDEGPNGDDGSGEDREGFWTPNDAALGERDDGGRGRRGREVERDGMKWPVGPGEGWVAL